MHGSQSTHMNGANEQRSFEPSEGQKRSHGAFITPEAESERRQELLKQALSACNTAEILKVAAEPVLRASSMFDLLRLKSNNDVLIFLKQFKELTTSVQQKITSFLQVLPNNQKDTDTDIVSITDESFCKVLGIIPGVYKANNDALKRDPAKEMPNDNSEEPLAKKRKIESSTQCKKNVEDNRFSTTPGFSDSFNLDLEEFLNKTEYNGPTCPEASLPPIRVPDESNIVTLYSDSNPEMKSQISETELQTIRINVPSASTAQSSYVDSQGGSLELNKNTPSSNSSSELSYNSPLRLYGQNCQNTMDQTTTTSNPYNVESLWYNVNETFDDIFARKYHDNTQFEEYFDEEFLQIKDACGFGQ